MVLYIVIVYLLECIKLKRLNISSVGKYVGQMVLSHAAFWNIKMPLWKTI